ncbi:5-formyltetrahydrofolate cyclo-ligase [Pseudaquidulcibacter saccharophilus]|uniref:5-formyltetrahydrofolate cyclo-ligase n=1 Tax=Pseudaquidulcibacter saccharophilus TaxID=2831900 RepID=UPI001EFEFD2C|nr:5-formyltetrahydrofolate cyclo-ligase [Pseudaquidulcibacter saccharophilus]
MNTLLMSQKTLKAGLRKLYKQKRADLHKEMPKAGENLIENFPVFIGSSCVVAGYLPIQNEIDPLPLMRFLEEKGAQLCLPRLNTVTNSINFHEYNFGDELKSGSLGVLEPLFDAKIVRPNIMLVPLLAFDKNGYRLGYGGGYYDKAISVGKEKGKLITIGLGFAGQSIDNIPFEAHDKKLDYVLTDKNCFKFGV